MGLLTAMSVEQSWHFDGALGDVSEARGWVCDFLYGLSRMHPPATPDAHDDVLLVVTELASNAFAFAPGPFTLTLRTSMTGTVHVALTDTNPAEPRPRPVDLTGRGGLGWHLISALAEQTIITSEAHGKTVHAFLPW
ncbi:ATP-binding protein [Streptomyces agglomeratus]|uniref:ATP-binding protein n=1 Tax=Streptomyces agglomeratus TaxID=285458 RepID=UPI002109E1B0|nr:ATP-binding protein [Streptomyces agglomeratus]